MHAKLFEVALGITDPWRVAGVDFDAARKVLTISVDFVAGRRFAVPGVAGAHPVHDTVAKRYRHLNCFQHECYLEVRVPEGGIRQIEPDWAGKLAGFALLFEALVMALCREMPFAAVARAVKSHWEVENRLHWCLDVQLNEDQSRARTGFAANNLAIVRHIVMNLLRLNSTVKAGIKNKRLHAPSSTNSSRR